MGRITKDAEERKNEILDAARELFLENGIEKTSVSEIVKKVGVAKGLFYYYFRSKEDLVNALFERFIDIFREQIKHTVDDEKLEPVEKLRIILKGIFVFHKVNGKMVSYFYDEKNAVYSFKLLMKVIGEFPDLFNKLIMEGIDKGCFNTVYPIETVEVLLMGIGYISDSMAMAEDEDIFHNKLKASEYIIKRILGISDDGFSLL
ncbi:MAG: TetR/AcrR family transcriptional regulator [Clostridiaceae bacterium]|nr:TetR/AcrR family transcriptional regulator [Clostridiaceae bacterium]